MEGPHNGVYLLGRQPIFNRKMGVYGYELLYRASRDNQARFSDGDQATLAVVLNTFYQAGLDSIVGSSKAFVNATRNFLTGKYPIPLPPERTVIEVLEGEPVDAELVDAVRELRRQGFQVGLDDITSLDRIAPLLPLVQVAKVDITAVPMQSLAPLVKDLNRYHIHMVAEKVETNEIYRLCSRMGFDLFQGYFLCKPKIVAGRRIDTSRLVVLRSLARLQDPQVSYAELESIIAQDVSLSYKLLTLVNSGYYSLPSTIRSLRQAIALLGLNQMIKWMSLLLMASVHAKPDEISLIALLRARMAEGLSRLRGEANPETFFMVGLFSVLDALMDMSMDQVVNSLPLSVEVANALLTRQGRAGELLEALLVYERGDGEPLLGLRFSAEQVNTVYLEAVNWINHVRQEALEQVKAAE